MKEGWFGWVFIWFWGKRVSGVVARLILEVFWINDLWYLKMGRTHLYLNSLQYPPTQVFIYLPQLLSIYPSLPNHLSNHYHHSTPISAYSYSFSPKGSSGQSKTLPQLAKYYLSSTDVGSLILHVYH